MLMKNKILILIIGMILLSSCFVVAADNKIWFGINDSNPSQFIPVRLTNTGVLMTDMNFSIADIWNTNIGQLTDANDTEFNNVGNTLTIDKAWLETFNDGKYFRLDGTSTMQGNANLGGFNITNADWGNFNNLNVTNNSYFQDDVFIDNGAPASPILSFMNLNGDVFEMRLDDLSNPTLQVVGDTGDQFHFQLKNKGGEVGQDNDFTGLIFQMESDDNNDLENVGEIRFIMTDASDDSVDSEMVFYTAKDNVLGESFRIDNEGDIQFINNNFNGSGDITTTGTLTSPTVSDHPHQDVTTTASPSFEELDITGGTVNYMIRGVDGHLTFSSASGNALFDVVANEGAGATASRLILFNLGEEGAANFERLSLTSSTTVTSIMSQVGGTGTPRPLNLGTDATALTIDTDNDVNIINNLIALDDITVTGNIRVGANGAEFSWIGEQAVGRGGTTSNDRLMVTKVGTKTTGPLRTVQSILNLQNTAERTGGATWALNAFTDISGTGNVSTSSLGGGLYGGRLTSAVTVSDYNGAAANIRINDGIAGIITNARGFLVQAYNANVGEMSNIIGFEDSVHIKDGGGVIGNIYGLKLADQTATVTGTKYGVFQEGSNAINIFQGDTDFVENLTAGTIQADNGFTGDCVNVSFVSGIAVGCND